MVKTAHGARQRASRGRTTRTGVQQSSAGVGKGSAVQRQAMACEQWRKRLASGEQILARLLISVLA
jgi:hypothetical protein